MTLRVAVPNKGSLSADALQLLADAGYRIHRRGGELRVTDTDNDITFFFQRPKDIATYVGSGTLDVGITGLDLLINSGAPAEPILELGFARSQFRFAALPGGVSSIDELRGRRVATSFPVLVEKYLADRGIEVELVRLDGAVENAIELGVAEAIADVVETGESLRSAGLVAFGEPMMDSQAILIRSTRRTLASDQATRVEGLTNRLRGVLNSRLYVIMDYDCPESALTEACALTPGVESPTISQLGKAGWVAVRSLVRRPDVQPIMDELERVGCKAILVTALQACRV
jgi:ATP phosphoribosyltransferase